MDFSMFRGIRHVQFTANGSTSDPQTATQTIKRGVEGVTFLLGALVYLTGREGNTIAIANGQTDIAKMWDYHFDSDDQFADTNAPQGYKKIGMIWVMEELTEGMELDITITCPTTARNLRGEWVGTLQPPT